MVGPWLGPDRSGEAMTQDIKWQVVMAIPGEEELSLLAELTNRQDARVIGLLDPDGSSVGAGMAEIIGLPVFASLEEIPSGEARFLVHPPLNDAVSELTAGALDHKLTCVSARNFANLLVDHALTAVTEPRPATSRNNFDFLENETAAIHETLGRIEEALDREALLRWLLKLATKAVGAGSGSIMLFDHTTQELYVAFAHGLSQNTLHSTRVRLGEGISGRVALNRSAELIKGNQHPGSRRDRGVLQSAVCAPIVWQDQLLGVVNVSATDSDRDLKSDALPVIENLTSRFGLILERFLRLQTIRDGEIFRKLEEGFASSSNWVDPSRGTLCEWTENLQGITGSDDLSLSILTAGGDLLVAHPEGVHYESPPAPEKDAVLASGSPLVLRPSSRHTDDQEEDDRNRTIFHLPIGRGPAKALMSVVFHSAGKAHHFHNLSAEVIYLVNRHMASWLDKVANGDQVDRLTILAGTLTELGTLGASGGHKLADRVVAAACQLTGAERACILQEEENLDDCQSDPLGSELRREAVRLLQETRARGWSSTILGANNRGGAGQSLMVVPLQPGQPFPGLVLVNKKRLHPLDGAAFTEFDALFARRLLPVFHAQATRPQPATLQEEPARAAEGAATPPPPTPPAEPAEKANGSSRTPQLPVDNIRHALSVEIDRCRRYHTMVGALGFRFSPVTGPVPDSDHLLPELARRLRSSDRVGSLEDGTLLVIVPEDIQSLPALQARVTDHLRNISGQDDLLVRSAHRVYPGTGNSADELIDTVINNLR